tara:strand:+ start:590 stop:1717 length:1128 start_codon:yes stop_codon:yes gene_type:complete
VKKSLNCLGLMSGTSGDGVDASVINSDGEKHYKVLINKYFQYSDEISQNIYILKRNINKIDDVKKFSTEINELERKITLFHSNVISNFSNKKDFEIDLIGFHGQTILHSPKNKYSKQLGDGNLLSQLSKKKIIYNFRQNDLLKGGEGAPLSPIFHQIIVKEKKIDLPVCILNIGGISNLTMINDLVEENLISKDIGPGNCLIDEWIRRNKKGNYDNNGEFASCGKTNKLILDQALDDFENFPIKNKNSFDVNDFEINFLRGLDLEDGASTITDFTSSIIANKLLETILKYNKKISKVILCGGGRKNKTLIERIKRDSHNKLKFETTDDYGIDGDFVESQAFAYLAIRSYLKLPITFPNTTGCELPLTGGILAKNF